MKAEELLIYLSFKFEGRWEDIYKFIKNKEKPPFEEELKSCKDSLKFNFVTLVSENYPTVLKHSLSSPPFVLYYEGDLSLLSEENYKHLTVVGSRNACIYSKSKVMSLIETLPENIVIVSGLARGIDSYGMSAAIKSNKKVIAVLGNGIGYCYPKENEHIYKDIVSNGGLILSEYPPNVGPHQDNFRWRNRILAAIGDAIFVGEAKYNSGTRITINYALNYGKSVGCLPFRANEDSYCNLLIKQGADMIETLDDLKSLLNMPLN